MCQHLDCNRCSHGRLQRHNRFSNTLYEEHRFVNSHLTVPTKTQTRLLLNKEIQRCASTVPIYTMFPQKSQHLFLQANMFPHRKNQTKPRLLSQPLLRVQTRLQIDLLISNLLFQDEYSGRKPRYLFSCSRPFLSLDARDGPCAGTWIRGRWHRSRLSARTKLSHRRREDSAPGRTAGD